MSIQTNYRIALGVPLALLAAPAAAFFGGLLAGVDRQVAIDSATVAVAIAAVAILRGIRQSPHTNWSLEVGGLLAVLISVGALALRSVSLASSRGPLFYFTLASSGALAYVAHRIVRRLIRSADREFDSQTRQTE